MENDAHESFDRAAEKRDDLAFLEAQLSDGETWLLPLWQGQAFVRNGALVLLRLGQTHADGLLDRCAEIVWLGRYAGVGCFGIDLSPIQTPLQLRSLSDSTPTQLRGLLAQLPAPQIELCMSARALLTWHERHQYCSVCGQPSRPRRGGHLRVCSSSSCAAEHFPRTDPCVLVLICDGDRCLLGRSKGWPEGMFSALAGFVEPGETLEQAVARETLEEVGVTIGAMRYVGSQPWPFPASLMVAFVAQAASDQIRLDTDELEAARWVTRAELQSPHKHGFFVPPPFAIAGRLIAEFTAGTLTAPDVTSA